MTLKIAPTISAVLLSSLLSASNALGGRPLVIDDATPVASGHKERVQLSNGVALSSRSKPRPGCRPRTKPQELRDNDPGNLGTDLDFPYTVLNVIEVGINSEKG